ncbi:hypothetical protein CLV24_1523 [Pontibacter ummariensis]|uniref:Uncharacterized protein n=1 Tax=Pontibacter ummariensis TaxID=1610492 RepID=A0A239LW70_9BACT|nr:hypothetical protein [Pontibacter ummariensis]PRY01035.1 hypothetical protein CLV24_1523 [Pontibacter ummariensis]SNT34053.1 hypothetical protein SAMN06296052_1527 [Pontibacter ummariensis]
MNESQVAVGGLIESVGKPPHFLEPFDDIPLAVQLFAHARRSSLSSAPAFRSEASFGYLGLYRLFPQRLSNGLAVVPFVGHNHAVLFLFQLKEPEKLRGLTGLPTTQTHLKR